MNKPAPTAQESTSAHIGWELTMRLPKSQDGDAHRLLQQFAAQEIEILAYRASTSHDGTVLLLVTNNVDAACAAVRDAGYKCDAKPVIWVSAPCQVGLAAVLGQRLRAESVNLLYSYGSWDASPRAVLVFKTTHDDVAFRILNAALQDLALTRRLDDRLASAD